MTLFGNRESKKDCSKSYRRYGPYQLRTRLERLIVLRKISQDLANNKWLKWYSIIFCLARGTGKSKLPKFLGGTELDDHTAAIAAKQGP